MQKLLANALCAPLLACAAAAQATTPGAPAAEACGCRPAPLVGPAAIAPYSAVPRDDWTALFDQSSGWTGADGVYSIPLSGDERPCTGRGSRTFFTFSDTFIGEVDEFGKRLPGTVMVNNTQALLDGALPLQESIEFFWKTDGTGAALAMVDADSPAGAFFWPQDGLVVDGVLRLFAMRMVPAATEFGVEIAGVSQLAWTVDAGAPFAAYTQTKTPLKKDLDCYGRAVLPNTEEAHAPFPNGFVYVYGLRELPLNKELLVARVSPQAFDNFTAYRFWDGAGWSADMAAAAPIVPRLSSEFSVSPLADGRFILTYQQDDFLGPDITVRIGTSPIGPFGPAIPVYTIPDTAADPDLFAYGSKAHPHLSRPDRLLISYHLNTFDFADHFEDADIYRPRFVELPLEP